MRALNIAGQTSTLYVEDLEGERRPLILLHGLGGDVRTWDAVTPALSAAFRVIAIDLPGHGRSTADAQVTVETVVEEVAHIVAELGIARPAIWGHSLGGYVALVYATKHPVEAVICEDAGWGVGSEFLTDATVQRARMRADLPSDLHRELNAGVLRAMRELPRLFATSSCPICLLFARPLDRAGLGARQWTAELVADHVNIEVTWFDTPSHYLHNELPTAVVERCVRFLEDIQGHRQESG